VFVEFFAAFGGMGGLSVIVLHGHCRICCHPFCPLLSALCNHVLQLEYILLQETFIPPCRGCCLHSQRLAPDHPYARQNSTLPHAKAERQDDGERSKRTFCTADFLGANIFFPSGAVKTNPSKALARDTAAGASPWRLRLPAASGSASSALSSSRRLPRADSSRAGDGAALAASADATVTAAASTAGCGLVTSKEIAGPSSPTASGATDAAAAPGRGLPGAPIGPILSPPSSLSLSTPGSGLSGRLPLSSPGIFPSSFWRVLGFVFVGQVL